MDLSSALAVPVRHSGIEAVLLVADRSAARFGRVETEVMERFAIHAAKARHTAELLSPERRRFTHLKILHQISDYIQQPKELNRVLHAVLTGITAGYGLGFNRAALFLFDKDRATLEGRVAVGHVATEESRRDWARDREVGPRDFNEYLALIGSNALPPTSLDERVSLLRLPLHDASDAICRALSEPYLVLAATELHQLPQPLRELLQPTSEVALVRLMTDRPLGLLLADNKFTESPIVTDDVASLVTFANTAAIAVDNINRMRELEELHRESALVDAAARAVTDPAKPEDFEGVMKTIVREARTLCEGTSATLWCFDEDRKQFNPQVPVTIGIAGAAEDELRAREPRPIGTAMAVLRAGYLAVPDIASSKETFLAGEFRDLLARAGIRSFQGIALQVGEERVGVLYVSYDTPRPFRAADQRRLRSLATHAGLSLKNARLFKRVHEAQRAAAAVADMTVLERLGDTLDSVAERTRSVLQCDVVALHAYDPITDQFGHPAHIAGPLRFEDEAKLYPMKGDSIVRWLLERDAHYEVPRVDTNPRFKDTRFARKEDIKSCLAFPLRSGDAKVGVLFANFRTYRRFTNDEIDRARVFANQAAIAIRNAHRLREHEVLANLSGRLLKALTLQETLDGVVETATQALGTQSSDIVLDEGGDELVFRAAYGWEPSCVGATLPKAKGSQAGYSLLMREPVVVDDFDDSGLPFEVPAIARGHGLKSGLTVPMVIGDDVIGVLQVQTRTLRKFTRFHAELLSHIANQAAIAIVGAQHIEAVRGQRDQLEALHKAENIVENLLREQGLRPRREVLDQLLDIAMDCYRTSGQGRPRRTILGTVQLFHEDTLTLESVHPPDQYESVQQKIGRERPVRMRPIGLTGKAALTGEGQIGLRLGLPDGDPDYLAFTPATKSAIVAPIIERDLVGDRVVGVLNVESDLPDGFNTNDLQTLKSLAGLVAFALRNIRISHIRLAAHDLHRSLALAKDDVKSISRIVKGTIAVGEETSAELSAKLDGRYADSCFEERLAEDILAAAKVLDRAPLELRREPLAVLIQNVVNNLQFEAQRKQLTLQATILPVGGEPSEPRPTPDDELLYLMMDADRMRQVITNLVANAIKYTEKGSRVSVLAERTEDRIIVDVIDEGRGVPEELLEKIFEPYVRASSEDKGQGLGLSIAKTYVELHGGRIWAKRNECTGLTVHLELPAKRGERQ